MTNSIQRPPVSIIYKIPDVQTLKDQEIHQKIDMVLKYFVENPDWVKQSTKIYYFNFLMQLASLRPEVFYNIEKINKVIFKQYPHLLSRSLILAQKAVLPNALFALGNQLSWNTEEGKYCFELAFKFHKIAANTGI